ncbi:MAG: outer membrane protein assembly factor BamB family protein, partial [Planctomycetota bacterium]
HRLGGAIYCEESSPTINNCTISDNHGSGIFCGWSSPTITNCTISGNSAEDGGGIWVQWASNTLRIDKCTITGNKAFGYGGAVYFNPEEGPIRAIITNSRISGNSAGSGGGGIYFGGSDLNIINCIFSGNSAKVDGGGIFGPWDAEGWRIGHLTITNSTFSDNSAGRYGGGIFYENEVYPEQITLRNSILWGNTDDSGTGQLAQIRTYEGQVDADVKFTCIQDDNPDDANIPFGGETNFNIDDDPYFVFSGYWETNNTPADANDDFWVDGDYHLLRDSPCIEAGISDLIPPVGSTSVDIDGQPRLMGLRVDMGADEFELPTVIVTKPQEGDIWANGSTHEIKWSSYAVSGTVDIYYSTNNGAGWVTIDTTTNSGSFTWKLPDTIDSNQCLVSVIPSTPDENVLCIESGLFTIHPDFIHPDMPSKWKSLGGNFRRTGLSQDYGPEAGCIKWQFQTDAHVPATVTIGAGDRIHIACEDGKLYTLDQDGSLLWTYDTNSTLLSAPSVGPSGSVYVGSEDGKLYAVSIDGHLRWTHSTDGSIYSSPAVSENGTVYVCSTAGVLYALDRDGSELWTFETDSFGSAINAIFASPAIAADGTIYIGGLYDPNLYALDPNDGSVKWACSFVDPCRPKNSYGWPFTSPVVAADGTIYQTLLYDANLYAIEPNAGTIVWSTVLAKSCPSRYDPNCPDWRIGPMDNWPEPVLGPNGTIYVYSYVDGWFEPVLGPDGTIYVTLDGDPYLRAVDPNGSIKWVTPVGLTGGFTLTIGSDGLIYVATDDGYLYVLDTSGGGIARLESDNQLSFPVIASDGTMIISDSNNTVLAIGFNGCEGKTPALIMSEDLNADLAINFIDFAIMAADWLECTDTRYWPEGPFCDYYGDYYGEEYFLTGDINRDFYVNLADLAALAYRWLYTEAYKSNYIQAAMKFTPQALNCNSKGKWVKAHLTLPEGFLPEDVDVNESAIAEPMGVYSEYIKVLGNDDGPVRLEICFDRETFCAHAQITETGEVEVIVTGSLTTSRYFYATDTIRIINRR